MAGEYEGLIQVIKTSLGPTKAFLFASLRTRGHRAYVPESPGVTVIRGLQLEKEAHPLRMPLLKACFFLVSFPTLSSLHSEMATEVISG